MAIKRENYGVTKNGENVELITVTNTKGTELKFITYGAILVALKVSDKDGNPVDVFLGYDTLAEYEADGANFGAVIGRNCNRTGKGQYSINGVSYQMELNDGPNNLHSGKNSTSKKVWTVESADEANNAITLSVLSKDMEQDFPGNMTMKVTYTLTEDDSLKIDYEAVADQDTVANLTNHVYFNLNGDASGSCLDQQLKLYASNFTPTDNGSIPTGEIVPVAGTVFDFSELTVIGDRIDNDDQQLIWGFGYDHNFIIDGEGFRPVAEAYSEKTGIRLICESDAEACQLYAGNHISDFNGKNGAIYKKRQGFCLETQFVPDAINHDAFKSPILKAGDVYKSSTVYKFTV